MQAAILLAWGLVAALLLPLGIQLESRLEVQARVEGAEYLQVSETLARDFHSPFGDSLVLVVSGLTSAGAAGTTRMLDRIVAALESDPSIESTLSYRDTQDPLFLGTDGTGAIILVRTRVDAGMGSMETTLARLRLRTQELARDLQSVTPRLSLKWTGESALNADLRSISARQAREGEMRVLPIIVIALIAAFGSLVAAALPIGIGMLAIPLTLSVTALVVLVFPMSVVLVNVVTMLGLGLGIDYALLMVSRFREELAAGNPPAAAARRTVQTAGRTIGLSAATVAIGFLALLIVPINEIRSIAVGGLIVLGMSALLAVTLLPIVLERLGPRVNAFSVRLAMRARPIPKLWTTWARFVFRHSRAVAVAGALPLLALAVQGLRLDINLPRGDWLPHSAQSVQAIDEMAALDRSGFIYAVNVVVTAPKGATVWDESGWDALTDTVQRLQSDPRFLAVRSIAAAGAGTRPLEQAALAPGRLIDSFVSTDRTKALIVALPRTSETSELSQLVEDVRAGISGEAGPLAVGGLPALNVDYLDAVNGRFLSVAGLVMGLTFAILAWGYRSVLLPLKTIVLNLLSVAAAFGALVLVFQDGIGGSWLGLTAATGGVFPNIPILVFCIVFGLSMDYEVFLFNRVREAHEQGHDDAAALAIGLSTTAGLISSAALIMIVVFAGFCFGDFLLIKMLGFTLAVAILIDVTLVRFVVGPALFALAGGWNWWPGPALGIGTGIATPAKNVTL